MGSWSSKHDDLQPLLDDVDEAEPILNKLTILLFGHHGAGKNTVGNAILCKTAFKYKHRSEKWCSKKKNIMFGRNVNLIRVPGWSEDLRSVKNKEHWKVIKDSVESITGGPHLLIVIGDFNVDIPKTVIALRQILGDSVDKHILQFSVDAKYIVVGDMFSRTLIDRCRYHCIRCRCKSQSKDLLKTIENFILYKEEIRFYHTGKRAPTPDSKYQDLSKLVSNLCSHIEVLQINAAENEAKIKKLQHLLEEKENMLRAMDKLISNPSGTNHLQEIIDQLTKENKALKIENENLKRNNKLTAVGFVKNMSDVGVYQISEGAKGLQPSSELRGDTELQVLSELSEKETSDKSHCLEFLKKHRKVIIERVVSVQAIADELYQYISAHKYDLIKQSSTNQDKMRAIYNIVMKGGKKLQDILYKSLQKEEKYLIQELQNSSHPI